MNLNPKNNIFTYATNELSQDAFLCWLFSFAHKEADLDDPILKECAIDFLRQFSLDIKNEKDVWLSEWPEKQHNHIDVLLTVNKKYKIIIEDKTYSDEHNNQLKRYYEDIENEFPKYKTIGVFYKTGFQSNHKVIDDNNYLFFGIEQILTTLEKFKDKTSNIIFQSYYQKIKALNDEIASYNNTPVHEWDWAQINGFYSDVQNELKNINCGFGYVSNQSGGFYGMWLYDTEKYCREFNGNSYELYLQTEFVNKNFKICYKISSLTENKINRDVRAHFTWRKRSGKWINVAKENKFEKPSRYGYGKTVTLGIYDYEIDNLDSNKARAWISEALAAFILMIAELDKPNDD